MPSCRGAICHVSDTLEKPESLGHMTDFIYDHTMDRIKVDFKEVQFFRASVILFHKHLFPGLYLQQHNKEAMDLADILLV